MIETREQYEALLEILNKGRWPGEPKFDVLIETIEALRDVARGMKEIAALCDFEELPHGWENVDERHARDLDAIVGDSKLIADKALATLRAWLTEDA